MGKPSGFFTFPLANTWVIHSQIKSSIIRIHIQICFQFNIRKMSEELIDKRDELLQQ